MCVCVCVCVCVRVRVTFSEITKNFSYGKTLIISKKRPKAGLFLSISYTVKLAYTILTLSRDML